MARPIRETPILYGDDAKRFLANIENVKPASKEEKEFVLLMKKLNRWQIL